MVQSYRTLENNTKGLTLHKQTEFLIRTCTVLDNFPFVTKIEALCKNVKPTAQFVIDSIVEQPIRAKETFRHLDEVNEIRSWGLAFENSIDKYKSLIYKEFKTGDVTPQNQFVLAASVPSYREFVETNKAVTLSKELVITNKWIGAKNDIIHGTGQLLSSHMYKQFNKINWLVRLVTEDGNMIQFYSPKKPNVKLGELVDYSGKVWQHGHTEYGINFTYIKP